MNRASGDQSPLGRNKALWVRVTVLVLLLMGASGSPSAALRADVGVFASRGTGGQAVTLNVERAAVELSNAEPASAQPRTVTPSTTLRINYTYDDAGRLVEANYGGKALVYTYDEAGNLLSRRIWFKVYLPLVLRNFGS